MIEIGYKSNYRSNKDCIEADKLISEALTIWDELINCEWSDATFNQCYDLLKKSIELYNPETFSEQKSYILLAVLLIEKVKYDKNLYSLYEICPDWVPVEDDKIEEAIQYLNKIIFFSNNTEPLFKLRTLLKGEIEFLKQDFEASTFTLLSCFGEHTPAFFIEDEQGCSLPVQVSELSIYETLYCSIYNVLKSLLKGKTIKEYIIYKDDIKRIMEDVAENKDGLEDNEVRSRYLELKSKHKILLGEYHPLPLVFKENEERFGKGLFSNYLTSIEYLLIIGIEIQDHIKYSYFADELDHVAEFIKQLPLFKLLGDYYFEIGEYQLAYNQYHNAINTYTKVRYPSEYTFSHNTMDVITVERPHNVPNDFFTNEQIQLSAIVQSLKECENKSDSIIKRDN